MVQVQGVCPTCWPQFEQLFNAVLQSTWKKYYCFNLTALIFLIIGIFIWPLLVFYIGFQIPAIVFGCNYNKLVSRNTVAQAGCCG